MGRETRRGKPLAPSQGNEINVSVGNAVPGVPQVHRTCTLYAVAAFGGRNAEDGVPYGVYVDDIAFFRQTPPPRYVEGEPWL